MQPVYLIQVLAFPCISTITENVSLLSSKIVETTSYLNVQQQSAIIKEFDVPDIAVPWKFPCVKCPYKIAPDTHNSHLPYSQ